MLETVKKICNASLNKTSKQYENAKKIKHQSHKDLTQNETAKIMSFSPPLSFETAEKILNSPNKCFENVKIIIFSMDFNLNKAPMIETPKDISHFKVFATSQIYGYSEIVLHHF